MSKRRKIQSGFTRQGVRDLSYLKGKSVGISLPTPPHEGLNCEHPHTKLHYDHISGCTHCTNCRSSWDFDGRPI